MSNDEYLQNQTHQTNQRTEMLGHPFIERIGGKPGKLLCNKSPRESRFRCHLSPVDSLLAVM